MIEKFKIIDSLSKLLAIQAQELEFTSPETRETFLKGAMMYTYNPRIRETRVTNTF